jgi:hypothetical protein
MQPDAAGYMRHVGAGALEQRPRCNFVIATLILKSALL